MHYEEPILPPIILVSIYQLKFAFQHWASQKGEHKSPPKPSQNDNELYTKAQVKELLAIQSDTTIWSLQRSGALPAPIKIGRRCLWRRSEIDELIQNQTNPVRRKKQT